MIMSMSKLYASAAEHVGAVLRLGVSVEKLRYDRNASRTLGRRQRRYRGVEGNAVP